MGTGMKVGVERTDVGAGEPWGVESQGAGLAVSLVGGNLCFR